MIHIDSFLRIGSQHKICEDYIIKGNIPVPFIILSDGCSSSKNTDMGARILAHISKQYLRYRKDELHNLNYRNMGNWIIYNAELTVRQLGLNLKCLDATLIVSYVLKGEVYIYMYGDGCIVTKDIFGHVVFQDMEFSGNAPYYLSYLLDDLRNEEYHKEKHEKTNNIDFVDTGGKSKAGFAYDADFFTTYEMNNYTDVIISSDGLQSFVKSNTEPILTRESLSALEIIPEILAFKNTKGEFLKRRMNKAFKGFTSTGVDHEDDLSIGAYISRDK